MSILEWSDIQPRVELATPEEFDHAVDRLAARASPERPTIVALYAHDHQVLLGLGSPESFVQVQQWDEPGVNPALITVGDAARDGVLAFYLLGSHKTEIPRRNLIAAATARRIARQFLATGKVSEEVAWEPA